MQAMYVGVLGCSIEEGRAWNPRWGTGHKWRLRLSGSLEPPRRASHGGGRPPPQMGTDSWSLWGAGRCLYSNLPQPGVRVEKKGCQEITGLDAEPESHCHTENKYHISSSFHLQTRPPTNLGRLRAAASRATVTSQEPKGR